MGKIYVGTNWKMHKTIAEGRKYCQRLREIIKELDEEQIQLFIIPPYTSLTSLKEEVDASIWLGAQNMHWENEGAYTGEVSPVMLKEIGINMVELGHSERRQYYNENDRDINRKVHAALNHNIVPLVCIGETMEHKNNGISKEILSSQLKVCLKDVGADEVARVLLAYEPVWAIGSGGVEASKEYAHQMHEHIRNVLIEMYGDVGREVRILFGGSVNGANAIGYLEGAHVDGLFIGRSAWDLEKFEPILYDIKDYIRR